MTDHKELCFEAQLIVTDSSCDYKMDYRGHRPIEITVQAPDQVTVLTGLQRYIAACLAAQTSFGSIHIKLNEPLS